MKELKKAVTILAQEELKRANEKFPMFHSHHEAYAVLKEEIEETACELQFIKDTLNHYWENIKDNTVDEFLEEGYLSLMKTNALNLACEAIQVTAMIQKTLDSNLDKE